MVTEFPLALLSEMAQRDRNLDPYRRESALLPHSNGIAQNGTQNGSGLSEEIWSDMELYPHYFNSSNNVNPSMLQQRQLRNQWRSGYWASNEGSLSVGGANEARGLNLEGREGNRFSFHNHVEVRGRDTGKQNDFGGIFQDRLSNLNQSSAGVLSSIIIDPNTLASSNGSGSSESYIYGSILCSPLSQNGLPDPEVAMQVPSSGIPPIGVKLNSIDNRRMTTNGSSTFSTASAGIDASDQLVSAFSAFNLQQGIGPSHSSFIQQANKSNTILRSYAKLERENTTHSPVSRNLMHLPENSYSGLNMNGVPGLFSQTGNDCHNSLQISSQYLEQFFKSLESADMSRELAMQQQMSQQRQAYYSDYGFVAGYMTDMAIPLQCSPVVSQPTYYPNHIPTTILEEFKNNKTRCRDLSEIVGHVVEFSSDQYGSRFIQQKLETATAEEKAMVFAEIMPHAINLMTDVFGNYVVQKFFEHGSAAQIKELAKKLNGRVLSLSLQMYGCRVIQKAIEVVDLEQQTQMVAELEDNVLKCVYDQNGNHVIQKCIECVPQDVIHFIISAFYNHVIRLSAHAYGCRVIQRVLEHCKNPKTQQVMMAEILANVLYLSQDQYGNYVVQHVLQHGKPNEKSAIIKVLAGQILNMSRQKYASNVVEKCLAFGNPVERQMLIAEMLGPTEENEALQEMMKDQFGNYVVQKVLDTCSDQQREMIMTRIKIHLTALKKYTYGKHIVARVEKLVTTGERRLGIQSGASVSQPEEGVRSNYV